MPPSITLILGGARSGKSAWAEAAARRHPGGVVVLATATPGDAEMAARIAAHQASRPPAWRTVEENLDLAGAIRAAAGPDDLVLLDCLTLWLANVMLADGGDPDDVDPDRWAAAEAMALAGIDDLLAAVRSTGARLIAISNEVGWSLVPPTPLGRAYRDTLGRVNTRLAGAADSVVLLVAGMAVDLRALATLAPPLAGDADSG